MQPDSRTNKTMCTYQRANQSGIDPIEKCVYQIRIKDSI
jgi:hypothetical protein